MRVCESCAMPMPPNHLLCANPDCPANRAAREHIESAPTQLDRIEAKLNRIDNKLDRLVREKDNA